MLYVDDKKVTVKEIINYKGDDEIMLRMQESYKKLTSLFWDRGYTVRFKLAKQYIKKHPKSGLTEYKGGIRIPYAQTIQTEGGTRRVVYCESAAMKDNQPDYRPPHKWFRKKEVFEKNDIERAIYYDCISSVIAQSRAIILEDKAGEAVQLANQRAKTAKLDFYLYDPESPIYNNVDKVHQLAAVWGVSVGNNPIEMVKNQLRAAVVNGESKNMGYEKFNESVKDLSALFIAMADIQKGLDKALLEYKNYTWYFVEPDKEEGVRICAVSPGEDKEKIKMLAKYLMGDEEVYGLLKMALDEGGSAVKGFSELKSAPVKTGEQVDGEEKDILVKKLKETNYDNLAYFDMKRLAMQAESIGYTSGSAGKMDMLKAKLMAFAATLQEVSV